MKLKSFERPLFIEELTFRINTNLIEKYLQLDYEIWVKGLELLEGFAGSEIWISESNPGEVTSIIYWTDYKYYKNIDKDWLSDRKKMMSELMGEENVEFVRAEHDVNKKYKLREYK
ncbi:TIGR03792 family protein [Clostridioides difficile]|nr:TIGR03792 family protein [Clostridioides difficile]MDB0439484.1 TIGR03792 family protein [Clostridioides difficile]